MSKVIKAIYDACKANRDQDGEAVIADKDVAKIIKIKLTAAFPGVKFSVVSPHYSAVVVRWDDGPCEFQVDKIIDRYTFGGFDGSIDMSYQSQNWLLPNGDMVHASSNGTVGSMGVHPAYATDCPVPGAVLVKYGPKYIRSARSVSDAYRAKMIAVAEDHYGFKVPDGVDAWNFMVPGMNQTASSVAFRLEEENVKLLLACENLAKVI
jgi:Large polyvalent protein associated domain 29